MSLEDRPRIKGVAVPGADGVVHSAAPDVVAAECKGEQCTAIAGHAEGVGTIADCRAGPVDSFLPSKSAHTVKVLHLIMKFQGVIHRLIDVPNAIT